MHEFLPVLMANRRSTKFRIGRRFATEWREERAVSHGKHPYPQTRSLLPDPVLASLNKGMKSMTDAFPSFKNVATVDRWAGLIDMTPDSLPIVSPVEEHPGLILATGFSGQGFGTGLAAGQLAADLVAGVSPCVDPFPYRLTRFR